MLHICLCFAGPPDDSDSFTHELRGVIPRSFEYLFGLINREKQKVAWVTLFIQILFLMHCKCGVVS